MYEVKTDAFYIFVISVSLCVPVFLNLAILVYIHTNCFIGIDRYRIHRIEYKFCLLLRLIVHSFVGSIAIDWSFNLLNYKCSTEWSTGYATCTYKMLCSWVSFAVFFSCPSSCLIPMTESLPGQCTLNSE